MSPVCECTASHQNSRKRAVQSNTFASGKYEHGGQQSTAAKGKSTQPRWAEHFVNHQAHPKPPTKNKQGSADKDSSSKGKGVLLGLGQRPERRPEQAWGRGRCCGCGVLQQPHPSTCTTSPTLACYASVLHLKRRGRKEA